MNRLQNVFTRRGGAAAALAAAVSLTVASAHAASFTGLGVDNEYSTAANWDNNLVPSSANADSTQNIDGAFVVERAIDSSSGRTFVDGGATMNVTGGNHNDARSGASIYNFVGRGAAGTVNQSGGFYQIGHQLSIGGGGANGDGTYSLTGGTLSIYRGSNSIITEGANPHGRPSLDVSDEEAAGSALFEISGGSLETRFGAGVGTTGVFSVVGSGATGIGFGLLNDGSDGTWLQQPGGTLQIAVDAGGVTPIVLHDGPNGGTGVLADLLAGSVLDLGFDGIAPVAGTWTIMEAQNADINDFGLVLSGATASGWSFNVDNSGTNGLLTATYIIPEPGTLALFGLAGLATMCRRSV